LEKGELALFSPFPKGSQRGFESLLTLSSSYYPINYLMFISLPQLDEL
jgi:hypothetical protein